MDLSALVVGVIGLVTLAMKFTDFLKQLTNLPRTKNGVLTQLSAWAAAIGAVFLYSSSDFGPTVTIGDILLNNMSGSTKVILGLAIGSAGSVLFDAIQAFNNANPSVPPKLRIFDRQ